MEETNFRRIWIIDTDTMKVEDNSHLFHTNMTTENIARVALTNYFDVRKTKGKSLEKIKIIYIAENTRNGIKIYGFAGGKEELIKNGYIRVLSNHLKIKQINVGIDFKKAFLKNYPENVVPRKD